MLSRKYDKKIDIFQLSTVDDGFGGFTTTETLLKSVWANIYTKNVQRITDLGVKDFYLNTVFTIRNRAIDSKLNFVKYKNVKYVINSIENENLTAVDLTLNCSEYVN